MDCSAGVGSDDTSFQEEKCYDVVIVGFGPAALAQAIALYEQKGGPKNVLVLDRSTGFSWRGQDVPNSRARMRTNLMQDLVTARNPTSEFTFVNYLWATDNLVGYTNLGLINPPRQIFAMYLEWCAKKVRKPMKALQFWNHLMLCSSRVSVGSNMGAKCLRSSLSCLTQA